MKGNVAITYLLPLKAFQNKCSVRCARTDKRLESTTRTAGFDQTAGLVIKACVLCPQWLQKETIGMPKNKNNFKNRPWRITHKAHQINEHYVAFTRVTRNAHLLNLWRLLIRAISSSENLTNDIYKPLTDFSKSALLKFTMRVVFAVVLLVTSNLRKK
jgi:hypothetical protein